VQDEDGNTSEICDHLPTCFCLHKLAKASVEGCTRLKNDHGDHERFRSGICVAVPSIREDGSK
jgi:hypothetical protein